KRLSTDLGELVRHEIELFRVEMTAKAKDAGAGITLVSSATVAALFALAALTTTVILALALVMPAWLAALIVTVAYGIAAAVMAASGKKKLEEAAPPVPEQTIDTIREDVEWAKTHKTSAHS